MNKKLVVFVHGLGGDPKGTWGAFESLLLADTELHGLSVAYFSYPTLIFRLPFWTKYPGVQTLAHALATQMENRYPAFEDVTLVCHSLGGLIGKQYLIDCLATGGQSRVKRALFYAVPNNGASLAAVAEFISWRHPQLRQLCQASDVVRSIAEGWERTRAASLIDARYVVAAQDRVVDELSARQSWTNDKVDVLIDRGHADAVKPRDADDLCYLLLKRHVLRPQLSGQVNRAEGAATKPVPALGRPRSENDEVRVAFSAVLRIERDGHFLLVRNLHRPETFAPFGGVYKFHPRARDQLDAMSFRLQAVDADMRCDVRGFIPSEALPAFRAWFAEVSDRESAEDCLRRELGEELAEVGLSEVLLPEQLKFRHVRTVEEGPEFVSAIGCEQFRIFDVYEILEDSSSEALLQALREHSKGSPNLLWVDADSAKRGRGPGGWVIAAHVPYLFGTRRFREGDPPFLPG